MTRALVLGGGGPVGIGWESGLAAGLEEAGVRWADADLIVGTSAGSVVGAGLSVGVAPADLAAMVDAPLPLDGAAASGGGAPDPAALTAMMEGMAAAATGDRAAMVSLGRMALDATTVPEEAFVGMFAVLDGLAWPEPFRCTAVDTATGEFRVWDGAAGVELPRAVASSCSVPGIFPPITIGGVRYMDGGMRTGLNADVAVGHDVVVAVSCFATSLPEGLEDPTFAALASAQLEELARVEASGSRLELIVPGEEFLEVSGWGLSLMDPSRVRAAFDAGRRQAAVEADRMAAAWAA